MDVLPKSRLEFIQNEIIALNTENKKLTKENKELNELMKSLGPTKTKRGRNDVNIRSKSGGKGFSAPINKLAFSEELLTEPKYFKSPMSGIATRIFIHGYETALKSEEIMALHEAEPAYIKAYF